jgi:hypothetical protein
MPMVFTFTNHTTEEELTDGQIKFFKQEENFSLWIQEKELMEKTQKMELLGPGLAIHPKRVFRKPFIFFKSRN